MRRALPIAAIALAVAAVILWTMVLSATYRLDEGWLTYYRRMIAHGASPHFGTVVITLVSLTGFGSALVSALLLLRAYTLSSIAISAPLVLFGGYLCLMLVA
jgi:hypothetical protein